MLRQETQTKLYTERLEALETVWWKKLLPVQAPYRWNLNRLQPGYVLDIGCGIGRNLRNLGGNALGIDHNPDSVEICRNRGFKAMTRKEFFDSAEACRERFDSLLVAHVLEHLSFEQQRQLLTEYLPFLKSEGKIILITPQELGYASDPSHVNFVTNFELKRLAAELCLALVSDYSFPFPRFLGRFFIYNEFVVVLRKAAKTMEN